MKLDYALSDIHIFDYIPPTKSDSALSDVPNYYLKNIPVTKIKHMEMECLTQYTISNILVPRVFQK